jgi:hypothetical protein
VQNEEQSIQAAVEAVPVSKGGELDVIVLDDHSDDATASIAVIPSDRTVPGFGVVRRAVGSSYR